MGDKTTDEKRIDVELMENGEMKDVSTINPRRFFKTEGGNIFDGFDVNNYIVKMRPIKSQRVKVKITQIRQAKLRIVDINV